MGRKFVLILIILVGVLLIVASLTDAASGEEMFILCRPTTEINVRFSPKWVGSVIGHLYFGDRVETDGIIRNGFAHVVGLTFETGEGWVHSGLLVHSQPLAYRCRDQIISGGRVAARQYIGGKRNRWLKPGREVQVYAISKEWAITDHGYVQTEFLSVNYQVPE